jgi:glycosyltransferase involved in cell wall biosynthesis
MEKDKISIVIPVLNSKQYLAQCLNSIIAAIENYGPAELIIIDNGSTDGSYEMLVSHYAWIARIEQVTNTTISAIRNFGARMASGKYISFIDSDCIIPENYLSHLVQTFEAVNTDAAGCMVDLPPSPHWIEKTWQELHEHPKDGYVHFLNSGNFAVRKAVFEQSGGFDENLRTGEDAEYCQRLTASGFKIYQSRAIRAMHLRNPKSLRAFFSKNVWHALGMFGTFRHSWLDKPVLMTFVFLLSSAAGVAGLFLRPISLKARVVALIVLSLFAPVVTVIYRGIKAGALRRPVRSVLLYWLYYAARSYALFPLLFGNRKGIA